MNSILIIMPYFGKLPIQFPFWLQSAYNNSTIDFLLVTDNDLESKDNVKVVNIDFEGVRSLAQSKFDFPLNLISPYKLCDFKPAYGVIFADYIENYNFWGWGDLDLVYGDIRSFFTESILEKYNVVSGWGHLSLYKNNDKCRMFYKTLESGFQSYQDVFCRPNNSAFDEYNHKGLGDLWKFLYPDEIWDCRLFDDVRVPRLSFNFVSEFHPEYSDRLIFEYSDQRLYRIYVGADGEIKKEETLYAHFQQRKFMKDKVFDYNNYLIVPNEFIPSETVTIKKLNHWCRKRDLRRKIWNLGRRIERRFRIIFK